MTKILKPFAGICLFFLFAFSVNAQTTCQPGTGSMILLFNSDGTGTVNVLVGGGNYTATCVQVGNPSNTQTYTGTADHAFTASPDGDYEVTITPNNATFKLDFSTNAALATKLKQVKQWGGYAWTSFYRTFSGCTNLTVTATDVPNTSGVTDMRQTFKNCSALTSVTCMDSWNTANVTDMSNMFDGASKFNEYIGSWNTGKVTNMSQMFLHAWLFNQNIGKL
jgi:surface protein